MNPYVAEGLVRSHQQDMLAAARRHRQLTALCRPTFWFRLPRVVRPFAPRPAPCGC